MPSNITLGSVNLLFIISIIMLYNKYKKKYKILLLSLICCLLSGVNYHLTNTYLLLDITMVITMILLHIYYLYEYFINNNIFQYTLLLLILMFLLTRYYYLIYGNNLQHSLGSVCLHIIGLFGFFFIHNSI